MAVSESASRSRGLLVPDQRVPLSGERCDSESPCWRNECLPCKVGSGDEHGIMVSKSLPAWGSFSLREGDTPSRGKTLTGLRVSMWPGVTFTHNGTMGLPLEYPEKGRKPNR
ncbi:hypothetical protein FA95DRAFT_1555634 [Auriscalpium vulgare]|uniref:Uncharacterized protein n=1 Tax=Auriscalpium vulgare TaxID=40419 RepID=A0ACB8S2C4_9AGAM|nr:hypothetical protein FA95DRAFT_1555634 [Auriscalpium vulgare]